MKRYHLIILFPTSNTEFTARDQKTTKTVEAASMSMSEAGCYSFYNKQGELVASYPIKYTIIERVV